ncbi:RDD family protein [Arhodomonas sp. SL1]|uniref:RDD family protein n=1 Tax=Arhodomonas sp. SL1 TaxID=3425691 RepID=UPI003F88266C
MTEKNLEYAGFWVRALAMLVDSLLLMVICGFLTSLVYGPYYFYSGEMIIGKADFFINWLLPAIIIISFWEITQATPGNMLIRARIVDANSGKHAGLGQHIGRYLAYVISALPLFLGFLWAAFDPRKQSWHDKLANTVVVREIILTKTPVIPMAKK